MDSVETLGGKFFKTKYQLKMGNRNLRNLDAESEDLGAISMWKYFNITNKECCSVFSLYKKDINNIWFFTLPFIFHPKENNLTGSLAHFDKRDVKRIFS